MTEIWKDIQGYHGLYKVSNFGRVMTLPKKIKNGSGWQIRPEKILKGEITNRGYVKVTLHNNYKIERFSVHRLVALHFIENKYNKPQVNHKNGNKQDNYFENLEWATASENIRHSLLTGLNDPSKRDLLTNKKRSLTLDQAREIKKIYANGGISIRKIAANYSVGHSTVYFILSGRKYKTA